MVSGSPAFWRGKRVVLTGHTGFKGAWLSWMLSRLGAEVFGYALAPEGEASLFALSGLDRHAPGTLGDICDRDRLARAIGEARPDVVIHLAAQALVRRSYAAPEETWRTNVQGTLCLLEALRGCAPFPLTLVVTTDKVYRNDESGRPFRESDPLGGHDPYSASKAACELLVESWRESYAETQGAVVATARAGNVIGGGDFAEDRIVPDLWRAMRAGTRPLLRNPGATRPWQHVLDCLNGYLLYLEALGNGRDVPLALNFGPEPAHVRTVAQIADGMMQALDLTDGWDRPADTGPREMGQLSLDTTLARGALAWRDRLDGDALLAWTADWYRALAQGRDMHQHTLSQIDAYLTLADRTP
ncbi:CDP-glucose 4,6-dehydratase [Stappia sp.]|uniref:CDP-glucose 4,6-dehydratase n=1 Tax=Stappia sp. TaxID=1870903 RepID=UPI0032D94E77